MVCQAVEKQIALLSDKEILDFGGGTGLLALPPSQAGQVGYPCRHLGENVEQARLKADNKTSRISSFEQDLLANPLEQQFDLIVVSRVLHHMPDLDATLAMFTITLGRMDKFSSLILSRQIPTTMV